MATYVLIPGAGSDSWYWHLVAPRLVALGHDVLAPDLPVGEAGVTFSDYADVVVEAIGSRTDLVVVAQSLGGFTGPIVCERLPADLLVLVAAMVPRPHETAGEWWANTGHDEAMRAAAVRDGRPEPDMQDVETLFFHDVPTEVTAAAMRRGTRAESDSMFATPWPLAAWPDVPTKFLLCRDDRLFPADFQRRVVGERLGIVPDEMPGGHLPALAHPEELVVRLEAYRGEVG
ncbi:MAG TPA: alpha/beta hydrolase [Acidimicrobiia bacterium]